MRLKTFLFVALIAAGVPASAEAPDAEQTIGYRQSLFRSIYWNFAPVAGMVRGNQDWDAAEIKRRSLAVSYLATLLDEAFPKGSDQGAVTDALPTIWEQPDDFAAKLKAFQNEANALRMSANSGDQEAVKAQFAKVRETCAGCHESYRAD